MRHIYQDEYKNELGKKIVDTLLQSDEETDDLTLYIEMLANEGANLDYKDYDSGNTSLMLAIGKDFPKCFLIILEHNPNLELSNGEGLKAVHIASTKGNSYYLNSLCESNADINTPDKVGNRPINYAIKSGLIENIRILFRYKCVCNFLNKFGLSIYDEAYLTGSEEVISCVLNPRSRKEHKLKRTFKKIINNMKYSK